jgi:hypothetical protein
MGDEEHPVFVGYVTSIGKQYANLKVEEVLIGQAPQQVQMPVENYDFRAGKTYLVFAVRNGNELLPMFCGTTELEQADSEDLELLRDISHQRIDGWIQGKLWADTGNQTATPVGGIGIRASSTDRTFQATTNQAGRYRIAGVPDGKYTVEAQLPPGLSVRSDWKNFQEVQISGGKCAELSLPIEAENTVGVTLSGKLLDGGDRDWIEEVPVILRSANSHPGALDWIEFESRTDAEGKFKFENVAAGKYVLGANIGLAPTDTDPYPTTYYPGTNSEYGATVIELGHDDIENLNIRMPNPVTEGQVRVRVLRKAADPAFKTYLEYVDIKDQILTDPDVLADGTNRFDVASGYRLRAHAVGRTVSGEHVCAEPAEFTAGKEMVVTLRLSLRGLDCDLESYVVDSQ